MSETWFEQTAQRLFQRFLPATTSRLDALQIGVFRGDASIWLLHNLLTNPDSTLTDVDTWEGSDNESEHTELDWELIEDEYVERIEDSGSGDKVRIVVSRSADFFKGCDEQFDFIYIDGSHMGLDVLRDGIDAWEHLRPGGVLAFDDYTWGQHRPSHERPHDAIDALVSVLGNEATLMYRGSQVWLANVAVDDSVMVPGTVGVGVCSGTSTITTGWRHSYTKLLMADSRETKRVTAEHYKVAGACGVVAARNEIVEQFLSHVPKAEWLWFTDTDSTFAPSILEELLSAAHPIERPIMGGLAFRLSYGKANSTGAVMPKLEPMLYARINDTHFPVLRYPRNAIIRVNGLPTHCLLIHRSVLEDPRWRDDGHFHPWFRMDELGGKEMGEDFYFCWKAEQFGYPIHANTAAKTGHEKPIVFDEDFYLRWYDGILDSDKAMVIEDNRKAPAASA